MNRLVRATSFLLLAALLRVARADRVQTGCGVRRGRGGTAADAVAGGVR